MIPVVHTSTNDNHGFSVSFMSIFSKFTSNLNDFFARYASDFFLPCRRASNVCVIVIIGNVLTAMTIINTKVGKHQVKNCNHFNLLTISKCQSFARHSLILNRIARHCSEIRMFIATKIIKTNIHCFDTTF